MRWSGWYLLLGIFPFTIVLLLMKDGIKTWQGAMRQARIRRHHRPSPLQSTGKRA